MAVCNALPELVYLHEYNLGHFKVRVNRCFKACFRLQSGSSVQADLTKVKTEENEPSDAKSNEGTTKTKKVKNTPTKYNKTDAKNIELNKHHNNIIEVIKWSNATPIRHCADKGFTCCYCNGQYKEPGDLKKHTIENHPDIEKAFFFKKLRMNKHIVKLDITSLQCKICNQNMDLLEQFLKHLKINHQKMIYTDINNHIIPYKFGTEAIQCCMCSKTFAKFKAIQEHMHTHYRNYICDVCNAGYVNYGCLKAHQHNLHSNGAFKCEFCPQTFITMSKRQVHEKAKHRDNPVVFKCVYCGITFNDYRRREAHLVKMHDLKIPTAKCQACDKVLADRDKLRAHIRRVHLMHKPIKCPKCDMSFCASRELKNHMVSHTKLRDFKCEVCSKMFALPKGLREHMKIHNNDRRFKCEHCGLAFVQKCSWRGHMKSKHGENV